MIRRRATYLLILAGLFPAMLPAVSQVPMLELSRKGTLKMLQKLDSLVTGYTNACSFMGDPLTAIEERSRFLSLFESDSVPVFDDINPNIDPSAVELINERQKTAWDYTRGIITEFESYSSHVTRTNVASAAERMYFRDSALYTTVSLRKVSRGVLKDTIKCKTVNTDANLELWIRVYDTVRFDMKIAAVTKEGPLGVDWNYTYARLKRKKAETRFNLTPVYSQLLPHGFAPAEAPNMAVVNHNAFLESEYLSNLKWTTRYLGGSYGVNGDIEFRFFKKNEDKNRSTGFSMGIGGGFYNSFFNAEGYTDMEAYMDMDGDRFYAINHVEDLHETWMFYSADVPLKITTEKWKTFDKGRYFKLGARVSYMMGSGRGRGTLTRSAYYPAYGMMYVEDVPGLGFVKDEQMDEKMTLELNPLNVAVEMSFGRKWRSKTGSTIYYMGFKMGGYVLSVTEHRHDFLFTRGDYSQTPPTFEYQGILPRMTGSQLVYIGIEMGIKRADRNEALLKRKQINRLEGNGMGPEQGYLRTRISGLDSRDFSSAYAILIDDLPKQDRPVLFKQENKDPRKTLDDYIRERIVLTEEETERIERERDEVIHFSFIVDRNGLIQNIKLTNQKETEFGQQFYMILSQTSAFWTAGKFNGSPVDTKIEMMYTH